MVALQTEGYGFTIIELVEPADIELGDEMRWEPGTGLGGHVYANLTKGKSVRVFAQNHWVPKEQLPQQLLLQAN